MGFHSNLLKDLESRILHHGMSIPTGTTQVSPLQYEILCLLLTSLDIVSHNPSEKLPPAYEWIETQYRNFNYCSKLRSHYIRRYKKNIQCQLRLCGPNPKIEDDDPENSIKKMLYLQSPVIDLFIDQLGYDIATEMFFVRPTTFPSSCLLQHVMSKGWNNA